MRVGEAVVTFQNICITLKRAILGPNFFDPNEWLILLLFALLIATVY